MGQSTMGSAGWMVIAVTAVLGSACATGGGISDELEQTEDPTTSSTSSTGGMGGMATSDGGMGGMEEMGGMGGMGGMAPMCDFGHMHTCEMSTDLGNVSGDDGGSTTQTGVGSTWLKVRIKETNSSIFEEDLSYRVTLTSPPNVDYDLAVHQGPQDGPLNCNANAKPGVAMGLDKVVSDGWDDDQGLGGEDDSVWLAVEIRHLSGTDCEAEWTLTVEGGI